MTKIVLLISALLCFTAQGAVINGSFEDGLVGWSTLGSVQAGNGGGFSPQDGGNLAMIALGAGMATAQDVLSLMPWVDPTGLIGGSVLHQNVTTDGSNPAWRSNAYADDASWFAVAWASVAGVPVQGVGLHNPNTATAAMGGVTLASSTLYQNEGLWFDFDIAMLPAGNYDLMFAILDYGAPSAAAITLDAFNGVSVPEPSMAAIPFTALALGWLLRRRH